MKKTVEKKNVVVVYVMKKKDKYGMNFYDYRALMQSRPKYR